MRARAQISDSNTSRFKVGSSLQLDQLRTLQIQELRVPVVGRAHRLAHGLVLNDPHTHLRHLHSRQIQDRKQALAKTLTSLSVLVNFFSFTLLLLLLVLFSKPSKELVRPDVNINELRKKPYMATSGGEAAESML